ncbi:uncharacterized protein METZ01_LOCUS98542, partial [marine metagenome]
VLTLVGLARVDPGDRRAQTVDGSSHVVKACGVLTVEDFGSDNPGVDLQGGFKHASHPSTGQDQVVAQKKVKAPNRGISKVFKDAVGGSPEGHSRTGGDHPGVREDRGYSVGNW